MPFRLLALPAEIRNTIYTHALLENEPLLVASACKHRDELSAAQPALTRVNKQIRDETLTMFYAHNRFAAHIHRCDFGHLIAFMDDIGRQNRGHIRYVKLHLIDRWTCGTGLLDFFRWCVKSEATNDMSIDFSARSWNLEHAEWMLEAERRAMLQDPDGYDVFMGQTLDVVWALFELAGEMAFARRTSERQIRQAWRDKLKEISFHCSSNCYAEASTDCRDMRDAYHGYCSSRFGFVDNKAALAPKCQSY